MTTNLIPLLTRLAEAAPEMCKCNPTEGGPEFTTGEYPFFWMDGEFYSSAHDAHGKRIYVTGRPALAWLADALMVAIEARGWYVETRTAYLGKHVAEVYNQSACRDTLAEALLTALVAAVEAERVR